MIRVSFHRKPSLYRVNQDIELWAKPEQQDNIKDLQLKEWITQEREKSFRKFQEKRQKESSFEYKVIFVHGYLDLYGLDPYAFRLFAYIASRRLCSDSVGMIAVICKMSSRKVQTTLTDLVQQKLVYKDPKKGKPSKYEIAPFRNWQKPLENWENERALARLKTYKDKHGVASEEYQVKLEEYEKKKKKYTSELSKEMAKVRNSMQRQKEQGDPTPKTATSAPPEV